MSATNHRPSSIFESAKGVLFKNIYQLLITVEREVHNVRSYKYRKISKSKTAPLYLGSQQTQSPAWGWDSKNREPSSETTCFMKSLSLPVQHERPRQAKNAVIHGGSTRQWEETVPCRRHSNPIPADLLHPCNYLRCSTWRVDGTTMYMVTEWLEPRFNKVWK